MNDNDDENDGDETFNSSALNMTNENDFYKLLNVTPNATQEEIREAYKRRALEFHPDKNTQDTTQIFQAIKKAYETLYDEKRRMEYDADADTDLNKNDNDDENTTAADDGDDDEIFSTADNEQMKLHSGAKLSDIYKRQIDEYMNRYENYTFTDNLQEKLQEIVDNAMSNIDSNVSVDKYVQCHVCHQSCKDIRAHQRDNTEPYEKMFNNIVTSISFEQIISSDIWNWRAVEKTSVYFPIWNAREQWNQLSRLISRLEEPVQIICQHEKSWTLLIDEYEQNRSNLLPLPEELSRTIVVNYLPNDSDIQKVKSIFDQYDREEDPNIFSKLQSNDQRTTSGNYFLVDPTNKNKYVDPKDFSYPIGNAPSEVVSDRCKDCQKSFSFFLRHHHCRMCGQQFCVDCLKFKRIPHLGFITKSVRICSKCSDEKQHITYQHLFTFVQHRIESNRLEYLNIYLGVLYQYRTKGNESFYRQIGEDFYRNQQFLLALQCLTYARLENNEWLKYANEFCEKKEYSLSLTCLKLCLESPSFLEERANRELNYTFALLLYQRLEFTPEQLFDIASQKSSKDIQICLFYLLYLNIKYSRQINWKQFGEQILLKTTYDGSLAMFCFYLHGQIPHEQWQQFAEQLHQTNQFKRLAFLLKYLYHVLHIDFPNSKNGFIYFATKIFRAKDQLISLDDWLNDICDRTSTFDHQRIVLGLSFVHLYKYRSWIEFKREYTERKEYLKTLICHKMAECLCDDKDTQWLINGIEDFDCIAYEVFNGIKSSNDWKHLGDQYFDKEHFHVALNCYLFCESDRIDPMILQQASRVSLSTALLYYTVVYKRTRGTSTKILSKTHSAVCNDTFYQLCIVLSKQKNPLLIDLLKFAIKMYETDNRFQLIDLFNYHLLLLNEFSKNNDENGKNDSLINGGVHILLNFNSISSEAQENLNTLNESHVMKLNAEIFNELKSSTYKSSGECMFILLDPKNAFLTPLKQLLEQCLGRLNISDIQPAEYRSKMYFIQSVIFKLENNPIEAMNAIHNAVLSHPFDSVMFGITIFLNRLEFHSTIRQALIDDIRNKPLDLMDVNPPTQMKDMKFLQRTERLIVMKKYERAIIKRLAEKDPLQAAFSYLDLIMCVRGNATIYPMSSIMACVYFYKAMNNPQCKSAELYAYRSIIFDLSIEIFLYVRHYLSVYVQMYIYKLLFTIILRSNELFAKKISGYQRQPRSETQCIIRESHELLLNELLKNILRISQVNPLTHISSISTVHDMVYMECAGNELLGRYLQLKSRNSSLYQYHYFEGVWKGWIDEKSFADERQKCMQDLLDDHCWTMNDVEEILSWPLIPKTNDGWLLNTKHRLQFEQPAYSQVIGVSLNNDTGDIEFMFTQAKKNEHSLFDAADVMDVLTNGIVFAFFTLDPPNAEYHSHPFHEMRYLPTRLSNIPNYLLTLFHADYLLKMISTGVEICSHQPFPIRSSTDNLMQRLPTYIREELQAIAVNKTGLITDSIHRFWIQPESTLEYEHAFYKGFFGRTNDNISQFYLSDDLKMCVKQHRMKFDEEGHLVDDERENDDDESAEAQFARIFTKYYDEIGKYFPELLRLKELVKLGVLSRIIQGRYESQREFAKRIEADSTLEEFLKGCRQRFGRHFGMSNESDEKILNACCKPLCKPFFCNKSNLKPLLINWFRNNKLQPLLEYLQQSLIREKAKLKFTIEKFNFYHDDNSDSDAGMGNNEVMCSWVPAAFSSESHVRVYGGVMTVVEMNSTSGMKEMQEKSKSITRVGPGELVAKIEKQKSKQQRNNPNAAKGRSNQDGSGTAGGRGKKPPANELPEGSTTHSTSKKQARAKALAYNGLPTNAEPYDTNEVPDRNPETRERLVDEARANRSAWGKLNLIEEAYWHPDGYIVWLRPDTARSYNERRAPGSKDKSGVQKAHFNVFYEKNSGIEETDQHHTFDVDDD